MKQKKCKCGKEIRENQTICYDCYKKLKNFRPIARDEIVLDCDDLENRGDLGIRRICLMFSIDGYRIELWKAEGQKSYHAHIKNIPHIAKLPEKQNQLYKELIIKKYISEVRKFHPAPELDNIDFSLCIPDHLIAEENKLHFKYKTIKKPTIIINDKTPYHVSSEGLTKNFCDVYIYFLTKREETKYKPQTKGSGITAKIVEKINIIDIARQFGLNMDGNKCICPFHNDSNPSLVFYPEQGRFYCFGCNVKGNIIDFYVGLKELKPEFVYHKQEEEIK